MDPDNIAEAIDRIQKLIACKAYDSHGPNVIFGISDNGGTIHYLYRSDLEIVIEAAWMYSELLD
jgi:hypothetical protein